MKSKNKDGMNKIHSIQEPYFNNTSGCRGDNKNHWDSSVVVVEDGPSAGAGSHMGMGGDDGVGVVCYAVAVHKSQSTFNTVKIVRTSCLLVPWSELSSPLFLTIEATTYCETMILRTKVKIL